VEQQTATAKVLGFINSSPADLAPVFDAILQKATELCQPAFGSLLTWDGERFRRVAWHGIAPELIEATRQPMAAPPPGAPGRRIVDGDNLVSIADRTEEAKKNERLMTETREASDQQTATAEFLGVITSSPADLAPVFDAILDKATRLHDAAFGVLSTISDSGIVSHSSFYGAPALAEFFRE